uniref:Replication enhancer n=1 Tax=Pepper golden mosaic virus TaxID=223301 RepID=A0A0F7YCC6_9GEMI|nr:Replication enhancer protein [Pepper golden mosaic virus]
MDSRTGQSITVHHAENSVFIWEVPNHLFFRIHHVEELLITKLRIYHIESRINHNLSRALALLKAFLHFRVWSTSIIASVTTYLSRFVFRDLLFLHRLGSVDVNNEIRAVRFASDKSYVNYVLETPEIKCELY